MKHKYTKKKHPCPRGADRCDYNGKMRKNLPRTVPSPLVVQIMTRNYGNARGVARTHVVGRRISSTYPAKENDGQA